jgi:hypothetical protein
MTEAYTFVPIRQTCMICKKLRRVGTRGTHVRNEGYQARELTKTLGVLDAEGIDGASIWTFADPWLTYSPDPRHDLDMTSTSLVKTYARGHGATYPEMPWEPKPGFAAVASFYASH